MWAAGALSGARWGEEEWADSLRVGLLLRPSTRGGGAGPGAAASSPLRGARKQTQNTQHEVSDTTVQVSPEPLAMRRAPLLGRRREVSSQSSRLDIRSSTTGRRPNAAGRESCCLRKRPNLTDHRHPPACPRCAREGSPTRRRGAGRRPASRVASRVRTRLRGDSMHPEGGLGSSACRRNVPV